MRNCVLSLFATIAMALPLSAAPGPKSEAKPDKTAADAIRKALDTTGTFEFSAVTLSQVLNTINEQYKINVTVDRAVLMQMGMEPDALNVEVKLKDVKLRTALSKIAGQYNLTFGIIGDSILITTEEMIVYRQFKQKISVDVESVALNKVLKELAAQHGVKIIFDPRTQKSKASENLVSLQIDEVPLEAAVRLLCEMADLKPARMGNVIFVTTEARADKLKDGDSLAPTPSPFNPAFPQALPAFGFGGGLGGVIGVAPNVGIAPPAVAVDPPAKEEVKKEEPKKDEVKKEEPKKQ